VKREQRVGAIRSNKVALALILALVAGCSSHRPSPLVERLYGSLLREVVEKRVVIGQLPNGARLTIDSRLMFPAYSAQLDEGGQQVLNQVIEALFVVAETPVAVDDCPGGQAVSNCQLSAARATSVIGYLHNQGFDPRLLSVSRAAAPVTTTASRGPVGEANVVVMTITWGARRSSPKPHA
jgi:hypothetical protein